MGFFDTSTYTPTEILVSEHGSERREGITIASGVGILVKGTVLGKYHSGTNSGTFNAYHNEVTDGRGVASGILADKVDATSSGVLSTMYTHGTFYTERLTGLDSSAMSDLKDCVFINED